MMHLYRLGCGFYVTLDPFFGQQQSTQGSSSVVLSVCSKILVLSKFLDVCAGSVLVYLSMVPNCLWERSHRECYQSGHDVFVNMLISLSR